MSNYVVGRWSACILLFILYSSLGSSSAESKAQSSTQNIKAQQNQTEHENNKTNKDDHLNLEKRKAEHNNNKQPNKREQYNIVCGHNDKSLIEETGMLFCAYLEPHCTQ